MSETQKQRGKGDNIMSSALWIGSNGETEPIRDDWGMTAEEVAELEEGAEQERQAVRDYLYSFVHPAQLPDWLEELIVDHDYSPGQLAYIIEELEKETTVVHTEVKEAAVIV